MHWYYLWATSGCHFVQTWLANPNRCPFSYWKICKLVYLGKVDWSQRLHTQPVCRTDAAKQAWDRDVQEADICHAGRNSTLIKGLTEQAGFLTCTTVYFDNYFLNSYAMIIVRVESTSWILLISLPTILCRSFSVSVHFDYQVIDSRSSININDADNPLSLSTIFVLNGYLQLSSTMAEVICMYNMA